MSFSIIKKANRWQNNLIYNHRFKRMLKQRNYRVFLQQNTGYLPCIKTLEEWRKRMLYASFFSLTPTCLMTVIYWPWAYNDLVFLGPELYGLTSPFIVSGSFFIILFSFSMMFDYVIHKRDNKKKTFINW
jgi:hypothetical protein